MHSQANAAAALVVVAEISMSEQSVSRPLLVSSPSSMTSGSSEMPPPLNTIAEVTDGGGSQMRTVWSSEQLANMRGYRGFQATPLMQPSPCPDRGSRSVPVSRCHMYTFESGEIKIDQEKQVRAKT
jgi:hypothetical protein